VGDDANPCSRTAPCKTFAGAISKTAAQGEISVLDPGGFGGVTITKAITINGEGTLAGILVSGTNAINVQAGAADVVAIRNVSINGVGTGLNAIRFISGGELHVENVTIYNFTQQGIDFAPSAASSLFVSNTSILNTATAVFVHPSGVGTAQATLSRVTMTGNGRGLRVQDGVIAVARDSYATGSDANGFESVSTSRAADISLENCVASQNLGVGVQAIGPLAVVRMSNVMVTRNNQGLAASGGGQIISFGNNRVSGNNSLNGPPSSTPGQM
jgi:hypothetical protein